MRMIWAGTRRGRGSGERRREVEVVDAVELYDAESESTNRKGTDAK